MNPPLPTLSGTLDPLIGNVLHLLIVIFPCVFVLSMILVIFQLAFEDRPRYHCRTSRIIREEKPKPPPDPLEQVTKSLNELESKIGKGPVLRLLTDVRQNAEYILKNDPQDDHLYKVRVTADLKAVENVLLEYIPATEGKKSSRAERDLALRGLAACNKNLFEKTDKIQRDRRIKMEEQIAILDGSIYDKLNWKELEK